ncbi:MAG: trypsin-like peptidase domain-containing protein [Thaumarchaeota archaeon]|nr:trypsin-like peptidase domain-containing protein [Nitrososphaerota archaeon]
MTPETKPRSHKTFLAAVILVLVLSSSFIYYGSALAQQNGTTTNSTITSLENTISSLENTNHALQAQLSALVSNSSSTPPNSGLSPQQIYVASDASVVTVQGDQQATVNTIYGPQNTTAAVLGSGFVIDYQNSMYVVTNYHVVAGDSNLTVTFPDGNAYPAKVVGTDPYSDLAVVSVSSAPSSEFVPLQVVPSSNLTVGQQVYAIGNPYGLSGSMTPGIVSQLGRTIQDPVAGNFSVAGAIQFSAPINPGNSGGPLLDATGQVIGITTATVTSSQGIGFAIPSSAILRDLPSLIATGTYSQYSYLGIGAVDMNYQLAQASGTNVTYGVLIESIVAGGPAANAGLRVGTTTTTIEGSQYLVGSDIIVSINGTKIVNQDALSNYLAQSTVPGQTVQLGVIRSGSLTTVSLVLGTRVPA